MIQMRPATPADAAAILSIYAPYVVASAVSFELEPPTLKEMRARISGAADHYPWIVAVDGDSGVIMGYAYATQFRARLAYRYAAETSIYIAGNFQGQGIGRTLYAALLGTMRSQHFSQAIASITLPNDYSIKLHEAVGFRRTGVYREVGYKNERWLDVGIWQRDLAERLIPPRDILAFSAVGIVRA
ncbi:MAG: GNAT family N-acetyltransferase [Alphaproteobacteria bacterium]|nr:GNAT family N-acetyltransferase [Alphaproteobacteria bacterium]MDE2041474.1 N-acetyltransferase [Alphaproteobacteria bacterium]MDE2341543.1 N-acetyltransferase [Alphaproteobacteria bacterium]